MMNQAVIEKLTLLRQELHKYPELSGQEVDTATRIKTFFESLHPDEVYSQIGGEGILFIFNGNIPGPTTLLRCELDGLSIQELTIGKHTSKNPGKSHTCGHDGHMAILCGVGQALADDRPLRGRVVLLFQPAEETGEGASKVMNSPIFSQLNLDYAFALHNLPGYEMHEIILKKDTFTAASKGMVIKLKGRTSHAAHPEDGNSPAASMAKIIIGLQKLPEQIPDFSMVTVVNAVLGEISFGTSPGDAIIRATLRSYDNLIMDKLTHLAEELVHQIGKEKISVSFSYTEAFQTTVNHPEAFQIVYNAASQLDLPVKQMDTPFRWSEDFGQFSPITKTMLFGLGAGKTQPQLHEGIYDFPDGLIPTGVTMFKQIINQIHH